MGGSSSSAAPDRGTESSASSAGIDPREFVEEVDLQRKLKGTAFHELLGEEKWSEQLKGLQLVIESIGEGHHGMLCAIAICVCCVYVWEMVYGILPFERHVAVLYISVYVSLYIRWRRDSMR